MTAKKVRSDKERLVDRLGDMIERHKARMVKRRVHRGLPIPLEWLTPSYWWFRRCGWHLLPDFIEHRQQSESWQWWNTLSIETQYSVMRISRRSDDFEPPAIR